MPIQPQRTRTFRRIKKKLAGRLTTHYKKRKPKAAHCADCKKVLHGVPRDIPSKIRKLSKTQRRPERIYGGVICPACLKVKLEQQHQKKSYPLEVGRLCVKTSGREAGSFCVVVDKKDNKFVLVDGQVKRRNCNINHLISLEQKIDLKKSASTADVVKEFKKIKIEIKTTKKKTSKPKPKKQRKVKEKKEKLKTKKEKPKEKKEVKVKPKKKTSKKK